MLDGLVAELSDITRKADDGYVQRFDETLSRIVALDDRKCIGLLLPFFDDDAEYDEMMFSIVHAIERFDDETYVREIMANLATFYARSPRWAVIVHMRILNSPATLTAYEARLKNLSDPQKQVVSDVLNAVRRKNAKFDLPCNKLLSML
jgi:hypothetical protein